MTAASGLVRVLAYLAAELGMTEDGDKASRPAVLPDGWNEYIERSWDAWGLTFHRLKPADQPMAVEELAVALADLCHLIVTWLRGIGIDYG